MNGINKVWMSFSAVVPLLHSLTIMELDYRWNLDFAGSLIVTPLHNKYVLVMIEYFFKWLEVVALLMHS
jgi:hypothetical protein